MIEKVAQAICILELEYDAETRVKNYWRNYTPQAKAALMHWQAMIDAVRGEDK